MDIYDAISISDPQAFYDRHNICRIIMHQWENLLQYHDTDPLLLFKMTKRAKRKAIKDNEPIIENGLNFAPLCNTMCFAKMTNCLHEKKMVRLNNAGQYVLFPSKCFHQGFYNSKCGKICVQVQLFCRHSISIASQVTTRNKMYKDQIVERQVCVSTLMSLFNDLLINWNTAHSLDHFETCKDFDGSIDKHRNHAIPAKKFHQVPLIEKLVDQFTIMYPFLTVNLVWIINKSRRGSGFQSWHRDFFVDPKIIKTIIVNVGAMKRSYVPGEIFSECADVDSDDEQLNPFLPGEKKNWQKT